MSNAGQAILTIVGTVVGAIYGYPQLGFVLGSLVGNALFPTQLPTVRGPKLDDLTVTTSSVGLPVPIVYGAYRISGNIIWSTDLLETTSTEEQGGKGGPSQKTKTTTYSVNFAVGLCEGPIAGIRRIWAGGKLIYDRREQQPEESNTVYLNRIAAANSFDANSNLYLGDEDQLPDPLIESYEGVGNVPGYRGLAYLVLEDFQLADYGNNLTATALSFEVIVGGGVNFSEVTEYQPPYLTDWLASVDNPFNPDNDHSMYAVISRYDADGSPHVFLATTPANTNVSAALSDLASKTNLSSNGNPLAPNWPGFFALCAYADKNNVYSTTNQTTRFGTGGYDELDNAYRVTSFFFPLSEADIGSHFYELSALVGGSLGAKLASTGATPGEAVYIEYDGAGTPGDGPPPCALYYNNGTGTIVGVDPVWNWDAGTYPSSPMIVYDGTNFWYGLEPIAVTAVRMPRAPSRKCDPRVPPHTDPPAAPFIGFCTVDGLYYEEGVDWEARLDTASVLILQNYNSRTDYRQQVGPMLYSDDPNFSLQAYWEARYAEAEAAGLMPSGLTYPTDYPVEIDDTFTTPRAYYRLITELSFISTDIVRLMDIVADLCRRSGLESTQYNTGELLQLVNGYALGKVMDANSAIQPLRMFGFFDMVESDGVLDFHLRGRETVLDVAEEDMAAHESDSERPTVVEVTRVQDIDLPRLVRIKYSMLDKDYQPGEQYASRLNTTADQIIDLEIPVAMTDLYALQLADVSLYEFWWNRNSYSFQLSQKNMILEPTDSINIPVDGELQRVRILNEDFSIPGIKRIKAIRDGTALGVYTSYVTENGTSGGVSPSPLVPGAEISIRDTTAPGFYLNLPMLRDEDNNAGYYAALRQENFDGYWPGGVVLRSSDGGSTYGTVATATKQSITGIVTQYSDYLGNTYAFFPPGEVEVINYGMYVDVELDLETMELSNTNEDGILGGLNAAAIGIDGRWEIIQYMTAELLPESGGRTWRLDGLVRGRRSTDSIMNQILGVIGDKFITLNRIVRVSQELAGVGASILHKNVTSGGDANAVAPTLFASTGQSLKPFSPVTIDGTRDISDNITITWLRRSRFGQELPSGTDIPLGEASEEYEIDIIDFDEVTVLRTITGLTSPSYVYSAADQTIDFGSPQPAIFVDVYQISATVGRGYPGRGRNV